MCWGCRDRFSGFNHRGHGERASNHRGTAEKRAANHRGRRGAQRTTSIGLLPPAYASATSGLVVNCLTSFLSATNVKGRKEERKKERNKTIAVLLFWRSSATSA